MGEETEDVGAVLTVLLDEDDVEATLEDTGALPVVEEDDAVEDDDGERLDEELDEALTG